MKKSVWFAIWSVFAVFCLHTGNTAGKRGAEDEQPEDGVAVHCPALGMNQYLINLPPWADVRDPELVVVVHPVKIGKDTRGLDKYRFEIQKVLYGSYPDKTIELNDFYPNSETNIVAAVQSVYSDMPGFNVSYSLPGSDLKAEMALCQARLDYVTLAAHSIFTGTEVSLDKNFLSTVAVVRSIYGTDIKPGGSVQVKPMFSRMIGTTMLLNREERIYFVTRITEGQKEGKYYELITRLPLECEKEVKAALLRRDQYPVREGIVDGKKTRYREITFRGTNAEAIDLLGASGKGAATLGFQTLLYRRAEARPSVIAAIEKDMLEFAPQQSKQFSRLHQLIALLGAMCREDKNYDNLTQLVDKSISYIKGNPDPLPKYRSAGLDSQTGWPETEESRTDINRSFTWLLLALGEERAGEMYGDQLLALRDQANGIWKQEIQVALDAVRVEETTELGAAMARMKGIKPAISSTGFMHAGSFSIPVVAFSPDGKILATAGDGEVRLWNIEDSTLVSVIKQEGSLSALAFSPDGNHIYVAGCANGQIQLRFDTKTRQIDKIYEGHHKGITTMTISPDGKTMVTSSYGENLMLFWDTESGKIIRTITLPQPQSQFTLAPGGQGIIRQSSDTEWILEPFRGAESAPLSIPREAVSARGSSWRSDGMYHLSPDGKYLCSVEYQILPSNSTLTLRESGGEKKRIAQVVIAGGHASRIAFSPDGKHLVAGVTNNSIYFFSLPDLHQEARRIFPNIVTRAVETIAFSPDGKLVAIGLRAPAPYLYKMDTFEKITPFEGHEDRVTDIFFCNDGKTIRSYGLDRTVCLWDAVTMKMKNRIQLPEGYKALGIRPPDGRYAVCVDAAREAAVRIENPRTSPAKVVDTDTGKIVSQLDLPLGRLSARIHWIDAREAVVATWNDLCRFDYMEGKRLGCLWLDNSDLGNGRGVITEDGQSIFLSPFIGKGTARIETQTIDVRTGAVSTQKSDQGGDIAASRAGLVPDGKHFYVSNPDMHIYDRKTLEQVNTKLIKGYDIREVSFSGDGRRYAVLASQFLPAEDIARQRDSKFQSIIRIHETLSGKTLFAFPALPGGAGVQLSPDGKRLLVINFNGALELWNLPD
jgi:WD40 repeat protein